MHGDRVRITVGTLYNDSPDALVFVYNVQTDQNNVPVTAFDGSAQIQSAGGVKNGSTGVIVGKSVKAHRSQLKDNESPPGLGTNDFVNMVPVMLDYYQQLGWFPTDNIRVLSGGVV